MTEEQQNRIREWKFMECDACRAKAGSPQLCTGCLYNRELVSEFNFLITTLLEEERKEVEEKRGKYEFSDEIDTGFSPGVLDLLKTVEHGGGFAMSIEADGKTRLREIVKVREDTSRMREQILKEVVEKIEKLPDTYPALESDEYDLGMKEMKKQIINTLSPHREKGE